MSFEFVLKYVSKCVALIARSAITLSLCVELLIFHLVFLLTIRNLIFTHEPIGKMTFFKQKTKNENLALFEKHVLFYRY